MGRFRSDDIGPDPATSSRLTALTNSSLHFTAYQPGNSPTSSSYRTQNWAPPQWGIRTLARPSCLIRLGNLRRRRVVFEHRLQDRLRSDGGTVYATLSLGPISFRGMPPSISQELLEERNLVLPDYRHRPQQTRRSKTELTTD